VEPRQLFHAAVDVSHPTVDRKRDRAVLHNNRAGQVHRAHFIERFDHHDIVGATIVQRPLIPAQRHRFIGILAREHAELGRVRLRAHNSAIEIRSSRGMENAFINLDERKARPRRSIRRHSNG